ncbi:hypothetical protein CEXT_310951 [Caerostris extrusa]|uniref:Uncharacterized protein n=1 Tax=Caerostris extrusa TaxID=172846 RepID=A0AAV4WX85_CAEEX|nr:hypothetical protein CEXT_310951 [Caerostris extrusa]
MADVRKKKIVLVTDQKAGGQGVVRGSPPTSGQQRHVNPGASPVPCGQWGGETLGENGLMPSEFEWKLCVRMKYRKFFFFPFGLPSPSSREENVFSPFLRLVS